MTTPDPFAPPSGATPPVPPAAPPVAPQAPQPRFGAYAAGGAHGGGAGTPAESAWAPPPAPAPAAPTGLATATTVLAVVWTAFQVGFFLTAQGAVEPYEAALAAGRSLTTVITPYDDLASLALPVQVAMFVVGCLWLQQSRRVAVALSPAVRQARRPVWVWLGWVVPVVILWFPFQVVRDLRAAAVGGRAPARLGWWWASWLVGMWASQQASLVSMGARRVDPEVIPVLEGIGAVAMLVACVLWVGVVRDVTAALRARLAPAS